MIRGKTIKVGREPVDLAAGTRSSQVQVAVLMNHGPHDVWLGQVGDGYRLKQGQNLPGALSLGGSDHLDLVADVGEEAGSDHPSEVDVVLVYEEVWTPEGDG